MGGGGVRKIQKKTEIGNWKLETGNWKLEIGKLKLEKRNSKLENRNSEEGGGKPIRCAQGKPFDFAQDRPQKRRWEKGNGKGLKLQSVDLVSVRRNDD